MKTTKIFTIPVLVVMLMVCLATVSRAEPMGTAFTFQGRLMDKNKLAEGSYDFQFRLYDGNDPCTATQLESTDINDVNAIDGHFVVELDFGSDVFDGNAVWLETTVVRSPMGSDPAVLRPLLELTPTPYALYAKTAEAVQPIGGGGIVPRGGIIMWSGAINDIPDGWELCDGTNGTPDLRDRFIVGASQDDGGVAKTNITGSLTQIGGNVSHSHTGTTDKDVSGVYRAWDATPGTSGLKDDASRGWHTHATTIDSAESLPPYYALAFIMKL